MIRNRGYTLPVLALTILLAAAGIASALPGVSADDAKQIMPVSQVKRGMRGYGLTVFHGTKIEKFDVEVLGVLKQMNSGKDFILVRVGGGPITTRSTGVIAGMSGSPVYIKGKLVGAIAAGFNFTKEPIGMITPMADMLEALDTNLPARASGYSSTDISSEPIVVNGKKATKVQIDAPGVKPRGVVDGVLHMEPLMTPLMVSGLSSRGMSRLSTILEPYHLQPTAGPGGGGRTAEDLKATLVPGAAVGVSLASGDIDITGIGTLTYRRGEKVLAFGHPMLGIGAIDAPMSTAFITDVISGYQSSTKLGSPIKMVGRIFQDRPWSIAGAIGSMPKTIPITIQIDDQTDRRARTFRVNVINHPLLAARLATAVVGEAIFQTHPTPGDATAEVSYDVTADQIGKISRSNVFFDTASIEGASIADVGTLMQMLGSNPFYPVDIKSVNMKVKIIDKRNTASIDRIFIKQGEYEPGEKVEVGVVLRPYKKERITKTFSIKIPATAVDGKVVLQVRGGGSQGGGMAGLIGGPPNSMDEDGPPMPGLGGPTAANVDNVKQMVNKYLEREKNNDVVIQLLMRSTAMNVGGEKLSGLPSAIADVMKSSRNSGLKMERDEIKQAFPQDMIVSGSARLTITVKRKDLNERKSAKGSGGVPSMDSGDSGLPPGLVGEMGDDSIDSVMGGDSEFESMASEPPAAVKEDPAPDEDSEEDKAEPTDEATVTIKEADTTVTTAAVKPEKTDKPTTSADASAKASDVKTVVRQVKTWSQKTQADFAKGTFSGVSASSKNKLEISPVLRKLAETPEQFVWSLVAGKGGVYAGTGNSGKIYSVSESGEMKLFYDTGELEVHALARDAKGNVYAATSPHGKIFKIAADGKGEVLYKADQRYIMALALDGDGNLYAGTGDAGNVYRIAPDGTSKVLASINEQQVLSLHWDPHGFLLAGTGINGNVYKIDKYGKAEPIFDAPEDSITAVVSDSKGNVYAGTSPKGVIYKILPSGRSETVFTKATRVLSMVEDQNDNVYAVSDGTLVKIAPDGTVTMLDSTREKAQFLALALDESAGALYASTGNIGSVYISKCCDVIGGYESPVHDAKMVSKWGRVRWVAETPDGTKVEPQTRTGNVSTPDDTWTSWSPVYTNASGEEIKGKDARYIQYKVTLKTSKESVTPKVSNVTVSYLTPNQPPDVKLTGPVGGEVWSGKETIKWVGVDPDKDTLTYDVFYSKDGGKEWTPLVGAISGSGAAPAGGKSSAEIVDKVKTTLEKSPDVPDEMKKSVLKGADALAAAKPPVVPGSAGSSSSSTTYSWDTSKAADGQYMVKVVASDKTSNATGALNDEVISDPFTVCNTPPKVTLYQKGVEMKAAGTATVNGSAATKLVDVVGVQYRVDGGAWSAATAEDGVFDSPSENFTLTTDNLSTGKHKLEVQAVDSAGNASSATLEAKVS